MGFSDIYYYLDDKWYKLVDALRLHWLTDKIDKVMPSMVLFSVLFLILLFVIIYLAVPSSQSVKINFVIDGLPISEDFNFIVSVDGKDYDAIAKEGVSLVNLHSGSEIQVSSFSLNNYKPSQTTFGFSETINVPMLKMVSSLPVSLYFYLQDSPFEGNGYASFSCSNSKISDSESTKEISGNYLELMIPDDCGTLTISASTDGSLQNITECDSTTCMIYFESAGKITNSGNTVYPKGSLRIITKDNKENTLTGVQIKIYDSRDMQSPVDVKIVNEVGVRDFTDLVVGQYKVYAIKEGYLQVSADVTITENSMAEKKIILQGQNLGNVFFKFVDDESNGLSGNFILRDKEQNIVHTGTVDENGLVLVPIYALDVDYYFDFGPNDEDCMSKSAEKVIFKSSNNVFKYTIYEKSLFDTARIKVRVLDQDNKPVEDAVVLVKDNISGFELLTYDLSETDENGYTEVLLEQGIYSFRAYSGVTEGTSETITVLSIESDEVPEYETTVTLYYGYNIFNLIANDEYGLPMSFATVTYYTKPKHKEGDKVLGVEGKLTDSFKAGQLRYFKITEDDYLPFYSESRFIMPSEKWDANISMTRIQEQDILGKVKFLGLYDSFDGDRIYDIAIGESYYVGYDVYVYEDPEDYFIFEFSTGNEATVDKDKLYITEAYTSANTDRQYSDSEKELETLSDTKLFSSKWSNAKAGVYRVFYKIQIRNNASVHMYDSLNLNWKLFIDSKDIDVTKQTHELLVGGKSVCDDDSFCSRVTLLNVDDELYVDPVTENQYLISANKDYNLEFDLVNGLIGADSEIEKGYLQIYNANADTEMFDVVKNNASLRSYLKLTNLELEGPTNLTNDYNYGDELNETELYALFIPHTILGQSTVLSEPYTFVDFTKSKYIHGKMTFVPIAKESSYINFSVIDKDRKVVVRGKPALSLQIVPSKAKDMVVEIFPEQILVPNISQDIEVYVTDESGTYLSDADVTVKMKHVNDLTYKVYSGCIGLKTDVEGKVICRISSYDAKLSTYFQIQVEKEGYNAYYHEDFTPDLKVSDLLLENNPKNLNVNLIHPVTTEGTADITFINNSAVDLIVERLDLELDKYSTPYSDYLDLESMESYMLTSYRDEVIIGRERGEAGNAETPFKDFFKAKLNKTAMSDLDEELNLSGLLKVYFKTGTGETLDHEVPFKISVVADGYPTNAEDCLKVGFDEASFTSDGAKVINLPFTFIDSCVIDTSDGVYPVTLDTIYAVVDAKEGQPGLGSFSGLSIQPVGSIADSLPLGIPKAIASNVETDLYSPEHIGTLGFSPSGRKGITKYTLKFVAYVKTSAGQKRIESESTEFQVSVLNIEDCVKIYDESDKEITFLEYDRLDAQGQTDALLDGDYKKVKIKNVCENLTLKLRACYNNENERSKGCGELLGNPVVGIEFRDNSITEGSGIELETEKEIEINRPDVPGAYSIDFWAKLPEQFSYKKVADLKVNAKTSSMSGLFADYPFLEVHTETKENIINSESDIVQVYNIWIGEESGMSLINNFVNVMRNNMNIDTYGFVNIKDLDPSAGNRFGAIGITGTVIGSSVLATSIILIALTAAKVGTAVCAGSAAGTMGIGCIVGLIAGALIIITTVMIDFIAGTMDQKDNTYVGILNEEPPRTIDVSYSSNGIVLDEFADIMRFTADDRFLFLIHQKEIDGICGAFSGCSQSSKLEFSELCPSDYEVYTDGLVRYNENLDDCSWGAPWFEASDESNDIGFNPTCGAGASGEYGMESYVLIPCKLKSNLWGRSQEDGVYSDKADTGLMRLKFTDVDFSDCDEEWCYKTYEVKPDSDVIKRYNGVPDCEKDIDDCGIPGASERVDYIRVAFHNKKEQLPNVLNRGYNCTDPAGNVIGFTGTEAKPKLLYNWVLDTQTLVEYDDETREGYTYRNNNIRETVTADLCLPNSELQPNVYCDATQFFGSDLQRIIEGNTRLKQQFGSKISCPEWPANNGFSQTIRVNDSGQIFDISDPEVVEDSGNVVLFVPLKSIILPTNEVPAINAFATDSENTLPINCAYESVGVDERRENVQYKPYCKITLEDNYNEPTNEGSYNVYNNTITLGVQIGSEPNKVSTIEVDLDYVVSEPTCIASRPSTSVDLSGKMSIFRFVNNMTDTEESDMFNIQDVLHYQVYLMNDGFSEDFLKDFVNSCSSNFLSCPNTEEFNTLKEAINSGRLTVKNMYDDSTNINGPGLYNVHNIIEYPDISEGLNLNSDNAKITILLEKVAGPDVDYPLYYMPLNGRTGINADTVDRQGYGVDFTGDMITLYDNGVDTLVTGLSSSSNALKTLNIDKDFEFGKINKTRRGLVFEAIQSGSQINVGFVPNLNVKKISLTLANDKINTKTAYYYRLAYQGEYLNNTLITLPWYAKNYEDIDFTGQYLADTYPRIGMLATSSDAIGSYEQYSKIEYPAEQVTNMNTKYDLFTFVFTRNNEVVDLDSSKLNLKETNENVDDGKSIGVNTLNELLSAVDANIVCVGGNANNMYMFINEEQFK